MKVCKIDVCPVTGQAGCCYCCDKNKTCQDACQQMDSWPCPEAEERDVSTAILPLMEKISGLVTKRKAIEAEEAALKEELKILMEHDGVKTLDTTFGKVTYVAPTVSTGIDSAKVKKLYPAVYAECVKITPRSGYVKVEIKEGGEK